MVALTTGAKQALSQARGSRDAWGKFASALTCRKPGTNSGTHWHTFRLSSRRLAKFRQQRSQDNSLPTSPGQPQLIIRPAIRSRTTRLDWAGTVGNLPQLIIRPAIRSRTTRLDWAGTVGNLPQLIIRPAIRSRTTRLDWAGTVGHLTRLFA